MATPGLQCPLCSHTAHLQLDLTAFLKHIKLFHAHQAGFKLTCGIDGCLRTFTNFRTFQNHVSDMHRTLSTSTTAEVMCSSDIDDTESEDTSLCNDETTSEENTIENGFHDNDLTGDNSVAIQCSFEMLQRSSALFILGAKEQHKLTQSTVQGVIEGVTNLNQLRLSMLHSKV